MRKPDECKGCPLYTKGGNYTEPEGDANSSICFIKEFPDTYGPGGPHLVRTLDKLGASHEQFRRGHIINCQPPRNWLNGAPWEYGAIAHCRKAHGHKLAGHKVYVPFGDTVARPLITEAGLTYGGKFNNWQATVTEMGDSYIIPTFSPDYIIKGHSHLHSSQIFAIKRAMEIASFGRTPDPMDLVLDPEPAFMWDWLKSIEPSAWISVDIETARKVGIEEDDLDFVFSSQIIRINFASNTTQGITIPWGGRYGKVIDAILALPNPKVFWNARFDVPILAEHDTPTEGAILDMMLGWHILQSRLPKGLGFVTPFYADIGPWKHLSDQEFEKYSAIDAIAALHCAFGIAKNLVAGEQWDTYWDHVVQFDQKVLFPAEAVGLKLDEKQIRALSTNIQVQLKLMGADLQAMIPQSLKPLAGGWKREPKPEKYPGAFRQRIPKLVYVCTDCGEEDVTARHKCPKP